MTMTQNYGNIIPSTPILSADPNVKEDVMTVIPARTFSALAYRRALSW